MRSWRGCLKPSTSPKPLGTNIADEIESPSPLEPLVSLGKQFGAERKQFNNFVAAIQRIVPTIPSLTVGEVKDGEFHFVFLHATFRLVHTFRVPTEKRAGTKPFESIVQLFSSDRAFMLPGGSHSGQPTPRGVIFDSDGNLLSYNEGKQAA